MSSAGDHQQFVPGSGHAHERSDVSVKGLIWFLVILSITLAVVIGLLVWLFEVLVAEALEADPPPPPLAALRPDLPPGPLLQSSPAFDMRALRAQEIRELTSWQWVDRPAGIVQIPIERAMELVAEQGVPDWPPATPEQLEERPPPGEPVLLDAPEDQPDEDQPPRPTEAPSGIQPTPPPREEPLPETRSVPEVGPQTEQPAQVAAPGPEEEL